MIKELICFIQNYFKNKDESVPKYLSGKRKSLDL